MILARLILATAILASQGQAQDSARASTTRYVIQSTRLRQPRTVYVVPPHDYAADSAPHPVLILLDADDRFQFDAAIANVEFLASRGAIPSLIVVGIPNVNRTFDLTPRARGGTARRYRGAGGADAMTNFIVDEVLPFVRAKYRTYPTAILAGHSFGGLFAIHAAIARPEALVGVIAMSPSLWWNDGDGAQAYADSLAAVKTPLRLLVTSGGLETDIDVATTRFASRLEQIRPPTLGFARQRYPDDDHQLTPAPSLVDGLRFVFQPISLSRVPFLGIRTGDSMSVTNAFIATQQTYARGARALKLPEALPEPFVNTIGYAAMRELKLPRVAVWIFRQNTTNHPESANVYDSLGDALLATGDRQGARAQFQRAIDVTVRNKSPVDTSTQRKLKALERELGRDHSRQK